jgi:hypothetical protein
LFAQSSLVDLYGFCGALDASFWKRTVASRMYTSPLLLRCKNLDDARPAQREIHAGLGRRYAPAQKHKQTAVSRIMPGNIPKNFRHSTVSNRGIKEQSKINCLADAHLLAPKASTLRMMSWSENISHSVFISAISAGLASLAPMARAMLV